MGCDIHGFWEAQTPSGEWIAFRFVNDTRSYEWFGIIADVRSSQESLTSHRGIPGTASPGWKTYCERWGRDLHSHTHLTLHEVVNANMLLSKKEHDWAIGTNEIHEVIPTPIEEIKALYLPGSNDGKDGTVIMNWTGTLADIIGNNDIEQKVRMVVAFDN